MVADPVEGCGSAGAAIVGVVLAVVADPVDGLGNCAAGGAGGGVVVRDYLRCCLALLAGS